MNRKVLEMKQKESAVEVYSPQLGFESAPAWMTEKVRGHLQRVVDCHTGAAVMWKRGAMGAVICGIELHMVKKLVGHGRFGEVLDRWVVPLGISTRTANRYMELADGARKHLAKSKSGAMDPARMLGDGTGDLAEFQPVLDAIAQCSKPADWMELLECHQLGARSGRGGFHPPQAYLLQFAALRRIDAGHYLEWDEETRDDFRAWYKEQKRLEALASAKADPLHHDKKRREAAERIWKPILSKLKIGIQGKDTWSALPKEHKAEMAATLERLAAMIKATI